MNEDKAGPGRPVNTSEDPVDLSRKYLIEDLKFYRRVREDLKERYERNKETMAIDEILAIGDFLLTSVERKMKFHAAPAKAADAKPVEATEVDPTKVLEEYGV